MSDAQAMGTHSRKFPTAYADELDMLCEQISYDRDIFSDDISFFVRTDHVSLKCGQHGVGPYSSFRQIIESVVTCIASHTPIRSNLESIRLYLIPWVCINPAREYRVFVHEGQVTAISQQNLYTVYDDALSRCDDGATICDYFESHMKPTLAGAGLVSYSADVAILDDGEPYFIEVNPFGAEYSSGSSLFGWVEDRDILYGERRERTGDIYIRFTSR